jgi:hypothetical protein
MLLNKKPVRKVRFVNLRRSFQGYVHKILDNKHCSDRCLLSRIESGWTVMNYSSGYTIPADCSFISLIWLMLLVGRLNWADLPVVCSVATSRVPKQASSILIDVQATCNLDPRYYQHHICTVMYMRLSCDWHISLQQKPKTDVIKRGTQVWQWHWPRVR